MVWNQQAKRNTRYVVKILPNKRAVHKWSQPKRMKAQPLLLPCHTQIRNLVTLSTPLPLYQNYKVVHSRIMFPGSLQTWKKNLFYTTKGWAKIHLPKKKLVNLPKIRYFIKQTPWNCQNFQQIAKHALKKCKMARYHIIFPEQHKIWLVFTGDPQKCYTTIGCKGVPFSRFGLHRLQFWQLLYPNTQSPTFSYLS